MLNEGGAVSQPAVPTSASASDVEAPGASAPRGWGLGKIRERFVDSLARFSRRQLERVTRTSDHRTRLQIVSAHVRLTANQAALAIELLDDFRSGAYRQISWPAFAVLVGTVAYLINPADLVPDALPVLGQLDDAAVLQTAVILLRKDLRRYCAFKGYPVEQYFQT